MHSLFLALVLFPQVQRRAQAELDVVIGRDRLPTFNDRPRLPYIEALCKELMRWNLVLPMGKIRNFYESRKPGRQENDFQVFPIR
jgi:cytochrome P450